MKKWNLRVNINEDCKKLVNKIQVTIAFKKGEKITQDETIEYIIKNFKDK